jgi:transposase-like protein
MSKEIPRSPVSIPHVCLRSSWSPRRRTRNGCRRRDFDTRAGTIDVAIPKLRQGCYLPDWLLERRRRAEAAPTSVVATSYLLGVSTRRMEKLVEARRPISTPRWRRSGPGRWTAARTRSWRRTRWR